MLQIKILWFGGKFIALIVGRILEILECYFCMSGKVSIILQQFHEIIILHLKTVLKMNVPFDLLFEVRNWGWKFKNEDRSRPETAVKVLGAIVEKNPDNTVTDYEKELGVPPTAISHHLKLIGSVKRWINVFLMIYMRITNLEFWNLVCPSSSQLKPSFPQLNCNLLWKVVSARQS